MQEPVLRGTHYVAGKHLLFSCMLTIFYTAENSHLNLIPFLVARLRGGNKGRGDVFVKSEYRFQPGHSKQIPPTGAVNAYLVESHRIHMKMNILCFLTITKGHRTTLTIYSQCVFLLQS